MPMTSTTAGTKAAAPAAAAPVAPKLKTYALKTPVSALVTAVQYLGHPEPHNMFAGHPTREDPLHHQTVVLVQTALGGRPAFAGDWIVTDSTGASSVMKDQDFSAKYAVDSTPVVAKSVPVVAPVAAAKPVAPVAAAKPVPAVTKPMAPPVAKPVPPAGHLASILS